MSNTEAPKTCPHWKHLERHECERCSKADARRAEACPLCGESDPHGHERGEWEERAELPEWERRSMTTSWHAER